MAIVIIGAGMAAYSLVREFRKLNTQTTITLITQDDAANYAKPTLSNAFAQNKSADAIALADATKMTAQFNINIITHATVKTIDATNQCIHYNVANEEKTLNYQQLVLATGAHPIMLPLEGDAVHNVLSINHLDHYKQFRAQYDGLSNPRVLIIGAGLIGCEFANDLLKTNAQVHVVDLSPHALGRLLPESVATQYQQKLEAAGIQFELATTIARLDHKEDHIAVTLANGKIIHTDMVISAVGLKPNTDLAAGAQLEVNRGFKVNHLLQTNQAHIYAMGDAAEVLGHVLPYVMPIMQQARALAQTLNQQPTSIHYPAMPVSVKTPAAPLVICPAPLTHRPHWELTHTEDGCIAKAVVNDELVGFVLLGTTAGKERLTLSKQVADLVHPEPL